VRAHVLDQVRHDVGPTARGFRARAAAEDHEAAAQQEARDQLADAAEARERVRLETEVWVAIGHREDLFVPEESHGAVALADDVVEPHEIVRAHAARRIDQAHVEQIERRHDEEGQPDERRHHPTSERLANAPKGASSPSSPRSPLRHTRDSKQAPSSN